MSEAEDVIVDAARHASSYAMGLWQRNRARPAGPPGIELADVRQRLELFVEAALRVQVPIRTASPPPPRSLLSRWFEKGKRDRGRLPVPATDGVAVHLPPRLDEDDVLPATEAYRIAALQQAARIVRASP